MKYVFCLSCSKDSIILATQSILRISFHVFSKPKVTLLSGKVGVKGLNANYLLGFASISRVGSGMNWGQTHRPSCQLRSSVLE